MDDVPYEAINSFDGLKGPPDPDGIRRALERCAGVAEGDAMTIVAAMDATHGLSAYSVFVEDAKGERRYVHPTGILSTLIKAMCMNSMQEQKIYALKVTWAAGGDWLAYREDARDPLITELLVRIAKARIEAREIDREGIAGMLEVDLGKASAKDASTLH